MLKLQSNQNLQVRKIVIWSLFILVILGFSGMAWLLLGQSEVEDAEIVKVSLNSGFYDADQEVTVYVPKGMSVYYTMNCEEPTKENGQQYITPINLVASGEEMVYVLRFRAYTENGEAQEIINRTYFLGTGISDRYTTDVLHLIGEPEDLFGYENGIFVGGKLLDEFVKANPDVHFGSRIEANFVMRGRDAERKIYLEYFTEDGELLMEQNAGVRIHGGASRIKNQKSFQLFARSEYDTENKFEYPVIKNLRNENDGTVAKEHKRLIVRSGGTDNGFGYIRSEMIAELASEAGFRDVMHAEPVCVYINGEYHGIYWLENTYDKQYFENRYGEYTGEFAVIGGGDRQKLVEEEDPYKQYAEEYNEMYRTYSAMDLTVDENFKLLAQVLDVENYLQYFAIENYIGNFDWPGGNLKAYRYVAEDNQYTENTVFDGRYRHLLFDTDYGFGLFVEYGTIGIAPEDYTLEKINGSNTPLFAALMKREDCREYFVRYSLDLLNGFMAYDNVEKNLLQMHGSREQELRYMLEQTDIQKDSLWFWEDDSIMYYDNVEYSIEEILEFASKRPQAVLVDMILTFGYDFMDAYTLNIHKEECKSNVQVNGICVQESDFSGAYLLNIPVTVSPVLAKNEIFDYWLVNGEIREEEELTISKRDMVEQQVSVELVVRESEEPVLQIQEIRAKGKQDYIELKNDSNQSVSTAGYFLSDSEEPYKYALPTMTLLPGESKRFYGKNCTTEEALGALSLNFNLKAGETVTLTYEQKTQESIVIPELSANGIYRYDERTGKFVEIL